MRQFQSERNKYVSKRKYFTIDASTVLVMLGLMFVVVGNLAANI